MKQKIINAHLKGQSNRAIALELKVSKDTVNKYVKDYQEQRASLLEQQPDIDSEEIIQSFVEKPKYKTRISSAVKATPEVIALVEECMAENDKKRFYGRSKQEMKKIDIYEYLQEKEYDISYSTVKRLVRTIEKRHAEAFIRQAYELGDVCEFDWGTVKLNIGDDGFQKYQMAVFTAAKSNYRYARLYRSQDTAAFQESHADFFTHCKGSFHTMVYDNMKVAVKKFVGLTEKEPTTALVELVMYYGMDYRFCNIASGNEKGHVERSVEYVRRKVFSHPNCETFETLKDANQFLLAECQKLNARTITNGTCPMVLFQEEQEKLYPALPAFESCIKREGHVDKYSTVVVLQNHYSVPDTLVNKVVDIRIYSDHITIYHDSCIVAKHNRSFKAHDWIIDIYHYLRTLKRKSGALHQSIALLQMDTKTKNIYDHYYNKNGKAFLEVLELIYEKGVDPVVEALKTLEKISPLDMSPSKVKLLCEKSEEVNKSRNQIGSDYISIKTKNTLSQYDALRELQREQVAV